MSNNEIVIVQNHINGHKEKMTRGEFERIKRMPGFRCFGIVDVPKMPKEAPAESVKKSEAKSEKP